VQNGRGLGTAAPAPPDVIESAPHAPVSIGVRQRRRSRLAVAATVIALLTSGSAVAYTGHHGEAGVRTGGPRLAGSGEPADARPSTVEQRPSRDVAVQAMLDRRASALERRDRQAFLAEVDPAATGFRQRQARVFDAMRDVPFDVWAYELAGVSPFRLSPARQQRLGPEAFTGKVVASYRFEGYDHAPAKFDLYYTFTLCDGRWLIGGDTDGDAAGYRTQRQLWDLGPVNVVRGKRSIVLGLAGESVLERHAREADDAVPRVTRVWGRDWEQKVVVIAPDTQAQLGTLLGGTAWQYAQLAAVTRAEAVQAPDGNEITRRPPVGPAPSGRRGQITRIREAGTADRIVINPAIWLKLSSTGRRIVMTHEVTHVATRTANSASTPTWLSEGFADYVGYLGTGVPVDVAARELLRDIRVGGLPPALPDNQDFAPDNDDLAAAYEKAWLACRLIANEYREERLVAFYRQAGAGDDGSLVAAFTEALGTTAATFTASWHEYLAKLS
jgi:hypothetical protein